MSTIVKILNKSNFPNPEYKLKGNSGMDVRANISESITLEPFKRALIPTGLFVELPEDYEIQVRPRSGLAIKNGVSVLNTPGTVDENYTGEIKVILINFGEEPFVINPGDRIAQLVLAHVEKASWENISIITTETERGGTGFGHSGLQ